MPLPWDEKDERRSRLLEQLWATASADPQPGTWRLKCQTCAEISHVGQLVPVEGQTTLISGYPSCRCTAAGRVGWPVLEVLGMGDPAKPIPL